MDLKTMQASAERASDLLKLLGHPRRSMLVCELRKGEKSVNELAEIIGISQSSVSQHLARMRYQDVVLARRDGKTVYYSLKGGTASLLIASLNRIFNPVP